MKIVKKFCTLVLLTGVVTILNFLVRQNKDTNSPVVADSLSIPTASADVTGAGGTGSCVPTSGSAGTSI